MPAGPALAGATFRRSSAACRAFMPDGAATEPDALTRSSRPLDGPPPADSSSPADTVAATAPIMPAVIAVRGTRNSWLPGGELPLTRNTAAAPSLPVSYA